MHRKISTSVNSSLFNIVFLSSYILSERTIPWLLGDLLGMSASPKCGQVSNGQKAWESDGLKQLNNQQVEAE